MSKINKALFDDNGRRITYKGMRVFNEISLQYYKIQQPGNNFEKVLSNSKKYADVDANITVSDFKNNCEEIRKKVNENQFLKNLFKGIHVPFICSKSKEEDIGTEIEKVALPFVAASFVENYPNLHCKATMQGSSKLSNNVNVSSNSRYENFLKIHKNKTIVGWYFPQALQEYDIPSQSAQMKTLPEFNGLVLSGGVDTAAALIGTPGLLVNENDYPPVLCLSALKHKDERLMLCFKSYGQHLEFWGMSQMLTPDVTQVSEQWSGGITIFTALDRHAY
jgi:hypothetical protein